MREERVVHTCSSISSPRTHPEGKRQAEEDLSDKRSERIWRKGKERDFKRVKGSLEEGRRMGRR
jgi:hypothetical protein